MTLSIFSTGAYLDQLWTLCKNPVRTRFPTFPRLKSSV